MASAKELLQENLRRVIEKYGPDSRSARDLRTQLASLETIRGPSELAVLNSENSERYHGAVVKKSRSAESSLPDLQNLPVDPAEALRRHLFEEPQSPASTTEKPQD